jgi:hypothetical protein
MAAPITGPRGLVLLAREAGAFSAEALASVARVSSEAGSLLVEAMLVRTLARALSEFRAVDD